MLTIVEQLRGSVRPGLPELRRCGIHEVRTFHARKRAEHAHLERVPQSLCQLVLVAAPLRLDEPTYSDALGIHDSHINAAETPGPVLMSGQRLFWADPRSQLHLQAVTDRSPDIGLRHLQRPNGRNLGLQLTGGRVQPDG